MAENKYHFERLTPIDNMDLDVYEEAIDYVFNNPDVKNVAISGAYSAGKSSVLASYKKRHNDLRFLHIHLKRRNTASANGFP
jgi:DNA replication protein DnaC